MRIAIIKSNFTPYGGAEKYTSRLIGCFLKNNIPVDVITAARGDWGSRDPQFRQIVLKQVRFNNLLRLLTFQASVKQYLKKEEYKCILGMECTGYETHVRVGGGCHAAWIQRRCAESPWLRCASFMTNPFHRAMTATEKRVFLSQKLKRIICNSRLVEREIACAYPVARDKLTVVHNGVEWDEFFDAFATGLDKRTDILRNLRLNPDNFFFLFVGSGYERKGLAKAMMAMACLAKHTELIVVGKDKRQNRYEGLSRKLGIRKRVHFMGPQQNIKPFLQVSDAFVLPTIYDPFSNASLEALAMGLYLITTDANGCSEVIRAGAGCLIKNLRDEHSVAEAMSTALGSHLSKREIRGTVQYLDFEEQLQKIVDICIADMERG